MPTPVNFRDAMISNFQSAVAKVALRPVIPGAAALAAAHLAPQPTDFSNPMIAAAAAVGEAHSAAPGPMAAVAWPKPIERCAAAAFDLAKAKLVGDAAAIAIAQGQLQAFGNCDPRWAETVTEFLAHYTLAKHSDVPYRRWKSLNDFVLPDPNNFPAAPVLPAKCRIGLIGDWGTGDAAAAALLQKVAGFQPDVLIHLGDIYYSCTSAEADAFFTNCVLPFATKPRVFTLCGNHDMYAGGGPYYALLSRLGQPASFFCLRNDDWQLLALDTGFNDFDPTQVNTGATWVQDFDDRDDPYSELAWHEDKMKTAGKRRTVLLSHHQPFSLNSPIANDQAVNRRLLDQFKPMLPQVAAWFWGHEHNQVIYAPFEGVQRGRCVGASAVPVSITEDIYSPAPEFLDGNAQPNQPIPALLNATTALKLGKDSASGLYNLGFAALTLDGAKLHVDYFQYSRSSQAITLMYAEDL